MLINDEYWMQKALEQAYSAKARNEVPVGAILVLNNTIIGEGCNQPISSVDPTAHAEIIALRQGAKYINNYRLLNTTLYVTLEPCFMCAGAIVHSRIERLVYGAKEPKTGAIESVFDFFNNPRLNHKPLVSSGVLAEVCSDVLSEFFLEKRYK